MIEMARSSGPSQGFFVVQILCSLGIRTSKKQTYILIADKIAKDCSIHKLLTLLFFEMNRCVYQNNCGKPYRSYKRKLHGEPALERERICQRVSLKKNRPRRNSSRYFHLARAWDADWCNIFVKQFVRASRSFVNPIATRGDRDTNLGRNTNLGNSLCSWPPH
jgi:hypothetical protein